MAGSGTDVGPPELLPPELPPLLALLDGWPLVEPPVLVLDVLPLDVEPPVLPVEPPLLVLDGWPPLDVELLALVPELLLVELVVGFFFLNRSAQDVALAGVATANVAAAAAMIIASFMVRFPFVSVGEAPGVPCHEG